MKNLLLLFLTGPFLLTWAARQRSDILSPIPRLITPTTEDGTNKPRLILTALVNYGGEVFPTGPICTEGIKIAVDAIKNAALFDRFELAVEPLDDMCSRPLAVRMALDVANNEGNYRLSNRLSLIAGTTCSQHVYIGTFLQHVNHIEVGGLTAVPEIFSKRSLYNGYFSVAPSMEIFYIAIPRFIKSNGWNKVYLLAEMITYYSQLEEVLTQQLDAMNVTLGGTSKILSQSGFVPAADHIEDAVRQIKAFDPRIIILNTNNGAVVACWLHRYKLFGPKYVYIAQPGSFFVANSPDRYEWCSEEMLFEVAQSFILFNFGAPMLEASSADSLGINASFFEETLKLRIEQPDLSSLWFLWKYLCYEEVSAGALILSSVEQALNKENDTLLNWVTSAGNFQQNGSYIRNLMNKHAEKLRYKGLGSVSASPLNSRFGVTSFHQIQVISKPSALVPFSAALKPVIVAWHDSSDHQHENVIRTTVSAYKWRTADAHPPYDSLRILPIQDPIVPRAANYAIRVVTSCFILVHVVLLFVTIQKRNRESIAKSMPVLNGLILIGNIFILTFVLILPVDRMFEQAAQTNCMAASLILVFGFSTLSASILTKMHAAYYIIIARSKTLSTIALAFGRTKGQSLFTKSSRTNNTAKTVTGVPFFRTAVGVVGMHMPATPTVSDMTKRRLELFSKIGPLFVLSWAVLQTLIVAVWFGLAPIKVAKVYGILELSTSEISIAYQHYTNACEVDITQNYPQIFIGILGGFFLIIFLRSILLAFCLRSMQSIDEISDLHLVRNSSYCTCVAVIAGGAVIWSFFSTDPGNLTIAASILALAVVSINALLIFAPKVKRGLYL